MIRLSYTLCVLLLLHPSTFLSASSSRASSSRSPATVTTNFAASFAASGRLVCPSVSHVLRSSTPSRWTRSPSRGERFARSFVYFGSENKAHDSMSYAADQPGGRPSVASYRAPVRNSGMLRSECEERVSDSGTTVGRTATTYCSMRRGTCSLSYQSWRRRCESSASLGVRWSDVRVRAELAHLGTLREWPTIPGRSTPRGSRGPRESKVRTLLS